MGNKTFTFTITCPEDAKRLQALIDRVPLTTSQILRLVIQAGLQRLEAEEARRG